MSRSMSEFSVLWAEFQSYERNFGFIGEISKL